MQRPTPTPYRDVPPPIVASCRRSYGGLAVAFGILAVMDFLAMSPGLRVSLRCGRAEGTCVVEESRRFGTPPTKTFALRDISDVRTTTSKTQSGEINVSVKIVTTKWVVPLPDSGPNAARLAFADAAKAFLRSPQQDRLDIGYGGQNKPFDNLPILCATPFLLLLFAFLTPAVRVIADRGRGKLIVERRPFGSFLSSRREFDLESVRGLTVVRTWGSHATSTLMLVMADGSHQLPGPALSGGGSTNRLSDCFHSVLDSAR